MDVPTEGNKAYSDGEDIFYGYYFPNQGWSKTNSVDGITDSAAGGTALASGYKTSNGRVGKNSAGKDLISLTELAASLGKATAVMSTESSTGATPASFSAHAMSRDDTTDIQQSQKDLAARCGTIINCNFNKYSVSDMAVIEEKVTDTLAALSTDEDGFFLMYEEAHIDKHCHNNDLTNTFYAVMRFNQVIARFMEYAFYHPDTFVLITADHETGGMTEQFTYTSDYHTDANVPVFVYGMGAEAFDGKTIANITIPITIAKTFWGQKRFGDVMYSPLS
jgi:alkaline phosphatase